MTLYLSRRYYVNVPTISNKQKLRGKNNFMLTSWKPLTKRAGSISVIQCTDPDPFQNVIDPEHWLHVSISDGDPDSTTQLFRTWNFMVSESNRPSESTSRTTNWLKPWPYQRFVRRYPVSLFSFLCSFVDSEIGRITFFAKSDPCIDVTSSNMFVNPHFSKF